MSKEKYTAILEAERAVVGCLLLDSNWLREIELTTNDFTNRDNAMIFDAITQLVSVNQPVDAITVAEYLEGQSRSSWLPVTGGLAKNSLANKNVIAYADLVKRESRKRAATEIANNLLKKIDAGLDVVDSTIRDLMQLSTAQRNNECTMADAIGAGVTEVERAMQCTGPIGIPTGITDLNEMLSGLRDTDLYVIGARPSMGKTAFLLNMIEASNVRCGFFSGEQAREQIGLRMISINGEVPAYKLRTAKLEDSDWPQIAKTMQRISTRHPVYMNDQPTPHIDDITRQARKWKYQHNIKAIYIDYLQRIRADGDRKYEQMEFVVMQLKSLARELHVPVVVLSQINRNVDTRPNKRPYMSDLSDSSAIEKEADVVITIYRDEVYDSDTKEKGVAELMVLKNRHGPIGMVRSTWRGDVMRFEDYTQSWIDTYQEQVG